jgi:hypothetical protein
MKKLLLITLFISGCSAVGVSSNDCLRRVAAAEVSITEGYNSTTKLYVSDTISKKTAKKALESLDTANVLADQSVSLCTQDPPKAMTYLTSITSLVAEAKTIIGG